MKREAGALALLLTLLLLSAWNLRRVDFLTDAIGRNLDRAELALERERWAVWREVASISLAKR